MTSRGPRAPLQALDPRARLLLVALATVAAFLVQARGGVLIAAAGLVLCAPLLFHASWRKRLAVLALGGFVFGFAINWLFWPSLLERSGPREAERIGHAITLGLRLSNLALFSTALVQSTPHTLTVEALSSLVAPSARVLGNRVHTALFQLRLAIGFVPTLLSEAKRILLSQQLRGLRFEGPPLRRVRLLAPLFIPVFAASLLRAHDTSQTLIARGYRPGTPRPYLLSHRWSHRDSAALVLGAAWTALAFTL
jgi:energy-coupling factor transporter transmembrane protein EcfT